MGFSERESRGRGSFRKKKALSAVMDADLDMLECSAEASPAAMEHATTEVNMRTMRREFFGDFQGDVFAKRLQKSQ